MLQFYTDVSLAIAPVVGAALVGGLGSIVGGLIGKSGQSSANQANREIAREQMDFTREMSNTAHQREVKDLRAAGLNPILAAGGSGASSPSGASIAMQNPNADLARGIEKASSSAVSTMLAKKNMDLLDAQIWKTEQEADLTASKSFAENMTNNILFGKQGPMISGTEEPFWKKGLFYQNAVSQAAQNAASAAAAQAMLPGLINQERFEERAGEPYRWIKAFMDTGGKFIPSHK